MIVVHRLARFAGALVCLALLSSCGSDGPIGPGNTSPQVASVTPTRGPVTGGTRIQVSGANFASGASVLIGGFPATDVVVQSATAIAATTPAHAAGAVDVMVSVAGKSATLAASFTFDAPSGQPPVVTAITIRGTRTNEPSDFADLAEEVNVAAVVTDPDTAADQLTFEWTAESGTFTGTGATVKWRAPAAATTPGQVRITVNVTDTTANRASAVTVVRLHDSTKEVGDLARLFLTDFSDSSRTPEFVLRNFSTSARCVKERESEQEDIEKNRRFYRITASQIGPATVNFAFNAVPCSYRPDHPVNGDACATVPAVWDSLCLITNPECKAGETPHTVGVDYVTAVYEQSQWRLCASYFKGAGTLRPRFIR